MKPVESIKRALKTNFAEVWVKRINPVAIRVAVVDSRFEGMAETEREGMLMPHIRSLPEPTQIDITVLLALTPKEAVDTLWKFDFDTKTKKRTRAKS